MINNVQTTDFSIATTAAPANNKTTSIAPATLLMPASGGTVNGRLISNYIVPLYCSTPTTTANTASSLGYFSLKATTPTITTTTAAALVAATPTKDSCAQNERVRVQTIAAPTKLIKYRWNLGTLGSPMHLTNPRLSAAAAAAGVGVVRGSINIINNNNNNNNNSNTNNQNNGNTKELQQQHQERPLEQQQVIATKATSAFTSNTSCTLQSDIATSAGTEDKPQIPRNGSNVSDNYAATTVRSLNISGHPSGSIVHRTLDQENAFRRIEDVHNYAKSKAYNYPGPGEGPTGLAGVGERRGGGGSSNSSLQEYDVDDDDVDEDIDDDDESADDVDFVLNNPEDIDSRYENYLRNRKRRPVKVASKRPAGGLPAAVETLPPKRSASSSMDDNDTDTHVDIETVPGDEGQLRHSHRDASVAMEAATAAVPPEHHARRPMNAFLIFCKRHRAIVKERYKSQENRAITKILGDWWASLDANDKKCFTNLAQQNKDAFFSANPNFKWYKLPAPPLRNLSTRPSNMGDVRDPGEGGAYFKLADEAQMGELSHLMTDHAHALQAALGETSEYLSSHMPATKMAASPRPGMKRHFPRDDKSFSSTSSEEEALPKKSSRSCKGKIYQELISSGQIAANSKKGKTGGKLQHGGPGGSDGYEGEAKSPQSGDYGGRSFEGVVAAGKDGAQGELTMGESATFDLEEKIKELPALDLDAYLQRKRTTKKKKKITSKKRSSGGGGVAQPSAKNARSLAGAAAATAFREQKQQQHQQQQRGGQQQLPPTAVGSQKRKARKESITRRDVSAIENEVASVLALPNDYTTITGCYYYEESPVVSMGGSATKCRNNNSSSSNASSNDSNDFLVGTSSNTNNGNSNSNNNNTNNTSTSYLLILAEVAANRTEITN